MVVNTQITKVPFIKKLPKSNEYATTNAKGNNTTPNTLVLNNELLIYRSELFCALNKNPKLKMKRCFNIKPPKTIALTVKYNSKSLKSQFRNFSTIRNKKNE